MRALVLVLVAPIVCVTLWRAARRAESATRLRRLTPRARWRLPARLHRPLARALADADVDLDPEAAVELWGLALVAVVLLASSVAPTLAPFAVVGVLVAGPVSLRIARSRRERRFTAALPRALEEIAAELRGGGTVGEAVVRLARTDGPVSRDLRRVVARTRLGLGAGEALAAWPVEHDTPGTRAAAGALAVATTMGGRSADAIDGLAASLRHRLDAEAEARALSAQARLSALIVGAAPLGYVVFAGVVDPTSVGALVGTGVGRVCLVLGLGCEALAAVWIRRILGSEA
jgi:tight adherence protein B